MFYDLLIFIFMSYIKPQLTHTECGISRSCISYYSYIKPQLVEISIGVCLVVYRTIPTSNHNLFLMRFFCIEVVYRTIPTSNHNCMVVPISIIALYIVLFLHQTTTYGNTTTTTTGLYIVLFLHQTTTSNEFSFERLCCISYYSYIKPQPAEGRMTLKEVVYRTIPTSNHNSSITCKPLHWLYIVLFLHQTTTLRWC